ncbi:MAG: substrate-binding domain-containing protein [Pleurocapsa minor GSE-CHR-MK-17-07R]|jgi:ribose transport system substrate-binding protein|nr:substrate-binding domain-containing protein [Pleurocapsa minor GSE-CHR-MK 17-07R]
MSKKLILIVVLLALVTGAFATTAQDRPLRIAFSIPGLQFPFFVHMERQIQDEATVLGNIELVTFDGQDNTTKQISDLEAIIAEGYDGLIISPRAADALAPAIQEVIDAGIPVITIDRNVAGETANNTLAHVGADNVLGGEAQGNLILSLFPDGGPVFNLQGSPGASPAIDRNAGLHNVLDAVAEQYPIVFEQTANFNRADGLSVSENGLSAADSVPIVINAANDDMALGAVEALKARDLIGQVAVIGFDALPEALLAIQNGELTATIEQFPGQQARTALNLMVDSLRNGVAPAQHDNYLTPIAITLDNLDQAERLGEIMATEPTPAPIVVGDPIRIAFSIPGLQFPFFVHMERQIQDQAATLGNIELVTFDGQDNTTKQISDLEAIIAEGYDGLIISPRAADALAPAIQEVIDAGIPVVTIDRNVAGDTANNTLAHVGADNVLGGEAQANLILSLFPDGGQVFNLQGSPGASPAIDRNAGLHNVLDAVADAYPIVFEQTANFNRADGLSVTENGLSAADGMPIVINAANDDMALGAVEALKARDLIGQVAVIGFDALPEALLAIQNGELTATIEQFPGQQARTALDIMANFVWNGVAPAQHDNFLTPIAITLENLDQAERLGEIQQ